MSSKFGQIGSRTAELAALEHLKVMLPLFLVSQLWFYLGNSQVSVYRTIGPLVFFLGCTKMPFIVKGLLRDSKTFNAMSTINCQIHGIQN